eukprot:TRINITY_DN5944_c0_g1_i1.p1 TRINITY_DN5944_c0_g1~~TRINITY_DN5944_c0_g1_i1.p1  ORF type:complete len:461 (-),score=86.85 TRINITY_DN5944_c0_g1_i1:75-1457(-)
MNEIKKLSKTDQKITSEFLSLLDKANNLFSSLSSVPECGPWESYFAQTFDVYTKLWKFQQQHRLVLINRAGYGLKRWEIGEIASKIGQLYYHYYLRTSSINYLYEAFVFYEAILNRAYFQEVTSQVVFVKKLRYFARFIVVSLLLNKQQVVKDLINHFTQQVNEYLVYKTGDASYWQSAVREITLFLQSDMVVSFDSPAPTEILTQMRRTNWESVQDLKVGDVHPPNIMRNCLIVDNRTSQVKFSELTLDMYRMVLTLEPIIYTQGQQGLVMSVATEIPIKKRLLYRPSVHILLNVLTTIQNQQQDDEVLLIYISADGSEVPPLSGSSRGKKKLQDLLHTKDDMQLDTLAGLRMSPSNKKDKFDADVVGSGGGGGGNGSVDIGSGGNNSRNGPGGIDGGGRGVLKRDCLYPEDLVPFSRKPLFIILDSYNSQAFLSLSNRFGKQWYQRRVLFFFFFFFFF